MKSLATLLSSIARGIRRPLLARDPFEKLEARALMDAAGSALPMWTQTTAGDRPDFVASADLDRDGREDVVAGSGMSGMNSDAYVSVMFNRGGSFREPIRYRLNDSNGNAAFGMITDLALADVNNDTFVDIVALVGSSSAIHVLFNNGQGAFGSQARSDSGLGSNFAGFALGQLTGDSSPDAAVTNSTNGGITVLRNDGAGNFSVAANVSTGPGPSDVVIADLDGDGDNDISTVDPVSMTVSVIGNTSSNSNVLTLGTPAQFQTGGTPIRIEAGDVLGDAKVDLVVVEQSFGGGTSPVVILENRSDSQAFNFNSTTRLASQTTAPQNGVTDVVLGDINADGKLDITAAAGTFVVVYRASGTGTSRNFVQVENLSTSTNSLASATIVRLVNINSDARPDLVYVNASFSPRVSYALTSNGRWSLPAWAPLAQGDTPDLVSSADLNGDGLEDVVTATGPSSQSSEGYVSVLFNRGGDFREAVRYRLNDEFGNAGVGRISDLALADVNGDTFADIVALVGSDSRIHVLLNDGQGAFGSQVRSSSGIGSTFQNLALGQLTGDSTPDAAVTNTTDNSVTVFRNDGTGRFLIAANAGIGASPSDVVVADFDGDGDNDIATGDATNQVVHVIANTSANPGTLLLSSPQQFQVGGAPVALAAGDVLGDSKAEIVVVNMFMGAPAPLMILENRSDSQGFNFGTRTPLPWSQVDYPFNSSDVAIGDVNGDGLADITVATDGYLALFRASGTGTSRGFFQAENYNTEAFSAFSLRLVNIDSDARPDVVYINGFNSPKVNYAITNGATWNLPTWAAVTLNLRPQLIDTADLNGDGRADVVAATGPFAPSSDAYVSVLFNRGGNFRQAIQYRINDSNGNAITGGISDIGLADVNGDGFVDIVALMGSASVIQVLLNDGQGAFGAQLSSNSAIGASFGKLDLGQLTGSAAPDAAVTNPSNGSVTVFRNDGAGNFSVAANISTGTSPSDVVIADLDGDGDNDIAVSDSANSSVGVIRNTSTNPSTLLLASPVSYAVNASPTAIAAGDLLGDSRIDLVVNNSLPGSNSPLAVILENRSDAEALSFSSQTSVPSQSVQDVMSVADVLVADVDNNGAADIVVSATGGVAAFLSSGSSTSRTFNQALYFATIYGGVAEIAVANLDGSGAVDLVYLESSASSQTPGVGYATSWVPAVNSRPSVATPTLSPTSGLVGTSVTLTASPTDTDGTIAQVAVFDDANGNGGIDAQETQLGVDTNAADGWSISFTVPGTWAVGSRQLLVRATDNLGSQSSAVAATFTVSTNAAPAVTAFTSTPSSAAPGAVISLAASATDSDGSVAAVRFYYDTAGTWDTGDTLMAQDTTSSDGWSGTYTIPTTLTPGMYFLYAVATDNAGSTGVASATLTVTSNTLPSVTSFTAQPTSVVVGATVNLTVLASDPDPADSVGVVMFYDDTNGNGVLDTTDTVLPSDFTAGDGWTLAYTVPAEWVGTRRLFADATDSRGATSAAVPLTITVTANTAPVVSGLAASSASVTEGETFNLTATASDAEGAVSVVMFYRDVDANGLLDTAVDAVLGLDSNASDGFSISVPTAGATFGTYRYLAVAQDSSGASSTPAAASTLIHPLFGAGTVTPATTSVPRTASVIFTAGNFFLPTGRTLSRVEFYADTNRDGVFSTGDRKVGAVTRLTNGVANATLKTKGLPTGDYRVFARIQDNTRAW
ncbi:MAG: FG-GAP-like repeat-containing protein, partial [Phycisphaerales bacterium]